jgi:predicted ATPase/class 3 adenylate cyclase
MSPLPDGTVTFLLTDIEGSTRLWAENAAAMRAALSRHDALAADCFSRHSGTLVKARGEGDSLFAVFARTTDAVAAALEFQRALAAEAWPTETPLRVRIAIHPGEATLRDDDYYGPAVNRCARLRNIAHGGQVLLSLAACALAADRLPLEASLQDLGVHALRDLTSPEHVFQLVHPELPTGFGSLRSLDAFPNNLPRQLTSFVGREAEMAQVRALLENTHLLTLTGMGGCGKTRLSLQVAVEVLDEYPDGAWLVELARVTDPAQVPRAVASLVGVRDEAHQPLLSTLVEALRERRMLLILDNCEHLIRAVAELAETLLRGSTQVRVLATSREPLGIPGETTWQVPPLSVPDPRRFGTEGNNGVTEDLASVLGQFEAVRLFIDRAVLSQPQFAVTNENAPAVAQICHRLDGIPLAIELAAARVKVLSPEQIAARLDDRFRLLTGGSRTALPRQQTLRALIDWSYDLLSTPERALLRRLAPFAGGWTLDAAEMVCVDLPGANGQPDQCLLDAYEVLDLMTQLVDKSLIGVQRGVEKDGGGETRYRLLETVRQYALDRLAESGEVQAVHARYSEYFTTLAERAKPELHGSNQDAWLERLETEHDNIRAALNWSLDGGDPVLSVRLCAALWWFWSNRGYWREGREWISGALKQVPRDPSAPRLLRIARVQSESALGMFHWLLNEFEAADEVSRLAVKELREVGDPFSLATGLVLRCVVAWRNLSPEEGLAAGHESLRLFRELGHNWGIALTLQLLGTAAIVAEKYEEAATLAGESHALFVLTGDRWGQAMSMNLLGQLALVHLDNDLAYARFHEAGELYRAIGNRWAYGYGRFWLGIASWRMENWEQSETFLKESERLFRVLDEQVGLAHALLMRGQMYRDWGHPALAVPCFTEALTLLRNLGELDMVALGIEALACSAFDAGNTEEAALLCGATAATRERGHRRMTMAWRDAYRRAEATFRAAMDAEAFEAAWRQGETLTLGEAIRRAERITLPATH